MFFTCPKVLGFFLVFLSSYFCFSCLVVLFFSFVLVVLFFVVFLTFSNFKIFKHVLFFSAIETWFGIGFALGLLC